MSKTFSVNIPNIGVLIHNAHSCPKMSTPTQINGICLTLSLRKNGATVSITFSNWQRNGATVAESYFLLSCSMTS